MNRSMTASVLVLCVIAACAGELPDLKMLFKTSGQVSLGVHLYGTPKYGDLGPGYRSDLAVNTELIGYRGLIFDFLTAASTSIARLPETPVRLDKIRYTLTPDLRYGWRKTAIFGALHHECIHTVSRAEDSSGSTWWNVLLMGFGTKGAFPIYFIQKYNNRDFSLRHSFDSFLKAGYYLHGKAALIGHNHDYLCDLSGLVRYHYGLFRNQTIFVDLNSHLWLDKEHRLTAKIFAEINYVLLAFENVAAVYLGHCIIDENPHDNEYSLGTIGFKVIF